MICLNLGSGEIRNPTSATAIDENPAYVTKHDYLNLDLRPVSGAHVVCDVRALPIRERCVDHLLARHILEHFGHAETLELLEEWRRVLKNGGTLEIIVPNLVREWRWRIDDEADAYELVVKSLYGGQRNVYDYHKNAFNWRYLREALEQAGYASVQRMVDGFPYSPENPLDLRVIAKNRETANVFEIENGLLVLYENNAPSLYRNKGKLEDHEGGFCSS